MTSSSPRLSGEPEQKAWFHDWKSGCEKQAHYFERIQRLQHELMYREQHNLVNAMERLNQLTYPRRKPSIKLQNATQFRTTPLQQYSEKRTGFPVRAHNVRKEGKFNVKNVAKKEKIELKPITGKPLGGEKISREQREKFDLEKFLRMPLLSEQEVAKIITTAQTITPKTPSTYLLRPHVPSIPSVGRRANLVMDNRLKLLTLAGGEADFPESASDISGTQKRLHTSRSQKRLSKNKKTTKKFEHHSPDNEKNRKEMKNNVLVFDVDPNDSLLFSHCNDNSSDNVWENQSDDAETPLPPPNSRPDSEHHKILEVRLDTSKICDEEETEDLPETTDSLTVLESTAAESELKESVAKDDEQELAQPKVTITEKAQQ